MLATPPSRVLRTSTVTALVAVGVVASACGSNAATLPTPGGVVAGTYVLERVGGTVLPHLFDDLRHRGGYVSLEADVIVLSGGGTYVESVAMSYASALAAPFVEGTPALQTGSFSASGAALTMSTAPSYSGARWATASGDSLVFAPTIPSDGAPRLYRRAAPVATVTLVLPPATFAPGTSAPIAVTLRDSSGTMLTHRVVIFRTSDPAVLTVDPGGNVTARAPGTAAITATCEGTVGSVTIDVFAPP